MNNQLRKIVEQAVSAVDIVTGNEALDDELAKMYIPNCFAEKFAELIVMECAQLLETNGDNQRTIRMTESTGHDKTTDWMEGYEEAVKQYGGFLLKKNAKQIMKHFGVEE